MLSAFDWMRRAADGAELLTTLQLLKEGSLVAELAAPGGALHGPCLRCWVSAREAGQLHCAVCHQVLERAQQQLMLSRRVSAIWGYTDRVPDLSDDSILGHYVLDDHRFLLLMTRHAIKPWLQNLLLEAGIDMRGLLQIFPTVGVGRHFCMGDILCRAIYHEANLPRVQLWIRFYSAGYQLVNPRERNEEGILSFEASEFVRMLEMAEVFRAVLRPEEQLMLQEILAVEDVREQAFHWGRLSRQLDQRANDMLNSWHFRRWSPAKVKLLYELVHYVRPPGID